ncbi:hypothetical protein EJV47_08090 [Hymenobacter gummosus]|uniref:Uncharacterized protein n=1 Tax=Hymenobacter gummosus TaxID=1776032 RepID=A0A431U5Y0_9BACT|nr:hypothetical protein [Hymenobacter gummosus]RTQ51744.1 hypothetical protein EJV47_08090 [Hymenobacter gummosus]
MLHAIHQNKAGRGTYVQLNWREVFKGCEDTLTSAVFGPLFHLPPEVFWQLLQSSFSQLQLPINTNTKLLGYQFWPRWDAAGTANARDVEPDLFIRTSDFDLIIEAKRYDVPQQYATQWENEVQAYFNEFGVGARPVFVLAIGGFEAGDEAPSLIGAGNSQVTVFKGRWRNLLAAARYLRTQLTAVDSWAVSNTLTDIIRGFELHGFTVTDWFATLPRQDLAPLRLQAGLCLLLTTNTAQHA